MGESISLIKKYIWSGLIIIIIKKKFIKRYIIALYSAEQYMVIR